MALYLGNNSIDAFAGWPPDDWKGRKPELIKQLDVLEYALSDTNFATWTPSTTASSIRATSAAGTFSANLTNYEYLIRWRVRLDAVYNEGVTPKATPHVQMQEIWQAITRRPDTIATMASGTFSTNVCLTLYTAPLLIYYNSSGVDTRYYSATYGLYGSAAAAAFSSTSSATPTITLKVPQLNARCSSTYFATGMAPNIDQENTKFKIKCEVYQMEIKTSAMRNIYEGLIDLYRNGI